MEVDKISKTVFFDFVLFHKVNHLKDKKIDTYFEGIVTIFYDATMIYQRDTLNNPLIS